MNELTTWQAAAVAGWAVALLAIATLAALLRIHGQHVSRATRQVERLLLLGKSGSTAEAIAAYERLNRIERAREEIEAQREREKIRGAEEPGGTDVARKERGVRNWFGHRRAKRPPEGG